MENKIEKFEDLLIWQDGVELSVQIYAHFKECKDYGFRDQVQRASVSIPSNTAEGFDRLSNNEFIRFLKIAKGSCAELRTQLIIAQKVGLLADSTELIEHTKKLSAMIQKMISYRDGIRKK
ncbi:MAG TPA: four helix bundle protein [Marinilabiliales bacterium]|nr:MAG: four helix bundle protein [Bacteroidetes bacterium GWA2_40_14]OFX74021.1 MAG: four helix bundle protein [Bacteroidetes bacterium GWD2_40_43]OFX93144.1 MAG: four helix bundle protein [Bacteroidetes bacterium GWE2_40_63]OFY21514.1 MAG: four helix bundle protein [Bacteroidetes bacterium GWF2_40_13]OFZ24168.1 MAG: four helix bundle protein [Bacteroidetes bacterium RIFOXYC2_FULL_40_12]HAM98089.1 four helix bundle protein [Marinilabiliales bacterium]